MQATGPGACSCPITVLSENAVHVVGIWRGICAYRERDADPLGRVVLFKRRHPYGCGRASAWAHFSLQAGSQNLATERPETLHAKAPDPPRP